MSRVGRTGLSNMRFAFTPDTLASARLGRHYIMEKGSIRFC